MKQEPQQESLEGSHAGSSTSGGRRGSGTLHEASFLPQPRHSKASHSPPSRSAASFAQYSDHNSRPHSPSAQFNYSIPSPSMPDPTSSFHHSPRSGTSSLPRLNPISTAYPVGRTTHSSSNSPTSAGPPTHASSFERDSGDGSRGTKRQRESSNGPVSSSEWTRKPPPFKS